MTGAELLGRERVRRDPPQSPLVDCRPETEIMTTDKLTDKQLALIEPSAPVRLKEKTVRRARPRALKRVFLGRCSWYETKTSVISVTVSCSLSDASSVQSHIQENIIIHGGRTGWVGAVKYV